MNRRRWFGLTVTAAVLASLVIPPGASAHQRQKDGDPVTKRHAREHRAAKDKPQQQQQDTAPAPVEGHQHGELEGHLLGEGAWGNIELVANMSVHDVEEGIIGDVGAFGNYAYLARYEPAVACDEPENVIDGGVYIIDIHDPTNPVEVGFIRAHQDTYVGEGVQVIHIDTAKFEGDILVFNNEGCGKNYKGGLSIYDVTDPTKPKKLSDNVGDFTTDDVQNRPHDANQIHSAFAWQAGNKAYVVMTDDEEAKDVDIMDITDPKHPKLIGEFDLNELGGGISQPELGLTDTTTFLHDMVVKNIGGTWTMLLSYWDGGYVQLDVDDPANPVFLGDTDYNNPDPELWEQTTDAGAPIQRTPEGNGHQAEYTVDNKYFIATDEDFAPYRTTDLTRTTGPGAPESYPTAPVGGAAPVTILEDKKLNGPVVYGGYGCPGSEPIPPASEALAGVTLEEGEEKIVVLQRGPAGDPSAPEEACFPGEKADLATDAGYDAVILVQRHLGTAEADEDAPFCGSGAFPSDEQIVTVCTTHTAFHELFGTEPNYDLPYPAEPNTEPDIGDVGEEVEIAALFDGWGYVHLYDRDTYGAAAELDTFAVPEAMDEDFASGFGDLSVHEVATDPTNADLAYLSYYSAGLRAIQIGTTEEECAADTAPTNTFETGGTEAQDDELPCLIEVGGYLDPEGNNFWGVEIWTDETGQEYILASDRDSGLWIFKQTSNG